uniref:Uncharacterized protein n=1 Tax=Coccidioides posadasii RMSCC 3488 TaxID=454284 RepID=A0A0J6F9B3_COCPO|nr:hypothetical protein CPAG_03130 [Coccidioides posadasii RMSCC 3488]
MGARAFLIESIIELTLKDRTTPGKSSGQNNSTVGPGWKKSCQQAQKFSPRIADFLVILPVFSTNNSSNDRTPNSMPKAEPAYNLEFKFSCAVPPPLCSSSWYQGLLKFNTYRNYVKLFLEMAQFTASSEPKFIPKAAITIVRD